MVAENGAVRRPCDERKRRKEEGEGGSAAHEVSQPREVLAEGEGAVSVHPQGRKGTRRRGHLPLGGIGGCGRAGVD